MVTTAEASYLLTGSFHLEIEGTACASFVRCRGLGASVSVLEYLEGGDSIPRKLRGDLSLQNIVLERGLSRSRELFLWQERSDRRDGSILLLDEAGREMIRWSFQRGWPCRWQGPRLDAQRDGVALETLEIAHEGLQWVLR